MARLRLGNSEVELWRGLANTQGLLTKNATDADRTRKTPCYYPSSFLSLLNFHVEHIIAFKTFPDFKVS